MYSDLNMQKSEIMALPIWQRTWFIKRLIQQKEKENEIMSKHKH